MNKRDAVMRAFAEDAAPLAKRVQIHYAHDCDSCGVYVDGLLLAANHRDDALEALVDLMGFTSIASRDDDFMLGQDSFTGVARNLTEIHEYREARINREARATALREQAEELLRQADELEQ